MIVPATASIHRQKNTKFIQDINIHISKIQDIISKEFTNDIVDARKDYGSILRYSRKLKKSMLESELRKISKILSFRFNITIHVSNLAMKDFKLSSLIMPNLNYKTLNVALEDINTLFPKRQFNEMLWNTTANINETTIFKTLNNITDSIREESIKLDLENAMVYGLDTSEFIINVDFFKAEVLNTEAEELTALLVYEIGRIFTYIEYMTNTTNNTLTLLDTFINEKFTKHNDTLTSLTIAMNKTNPNYKIKDSSIRILEELDMYMINTFNINNDKESIKKDFSRGGDIFATRFGVADSLSNLIAKRATDGNVDVNIDELTRNGMLDIIIETLQLLLFIITMIFLMLLGLLLFVVYVVYKLVKYILTFIMRSIFNIFAAIFRLNSNSNVDYDVVFVRLKKIKLELIRELRTLDISKEDKRIIVSQVDYVNETIKKLNDNISSLNKYGYIPNNLDEQLKINDMIESLEESEVYLYGEKIKQLKG